MSNKVNLKNIFKHILSKIDSISKKTLVNVDFNIFNYQFPYLNG